MVYRPSAVEQCRRFPHRVRQRFRLVEQGAAQAAEDRLLQREHECRDLRGREALGGAAAGQLVEKVADLGPLRAAGVELEALRDVAYQQPQEALRLFAQLRFL